jgi:hypothetical protein
VDEEKDGAYFHLFTIHNPREVLLAFLPVEYDGCCIVVRTNNVHTHEYIVINTDVFGFHSNVPISQLFHTLQGSLALIGDKVFFLEEMESASIAYDSQSRFSGDWKSGDAFLKIKKKPGWLKSVFFSAPQLKTVPTFNPVPMR